VLTNKAPSVVRGMRREAFRGRSMRLVGCMAYRHASMRTRKLMAMSWLPTTLLLTSVAFDTPSTSLRRCTREIIVLG
jgi:hypothetical protein